MARFDKTCTVDTFATTLGSILSEIDSSVVAGVPQVVEKGAKKARTLTKKNAKGQGWHKGVTDKRYVSGWTYKVRGHGREVEAEVGNRNTPGLPHLLEFGHAKVGGGRTTAYEHVQPAADEAFEFTFEQMETMVERAIR